MVTVFTESEREEVANTEQEQKQEEVAIQEEMPMRRDTIQEERRKTRRGERQRHKTDYYGQYIIVTRRGNP